MKSAILINFQSRNLNPLLNFSTSKIVPKATSKFVPILPVRTKLNSVIFSSKIVPRTCCTDSNKFMYLLLEIRTKTVLYGCIKCKQIVPQNLCRLLPQNLCQGRTVVWFSKSVPFLVFVQLLNFCA